MHGEGLGAIADGGQQHGLQANEQDEREARRDLGARQSAASAECGRGGVRSDGSPGWRPGEEPQAARQQAGESEEVVEKRHVGVVYWQEKNSRVKRRPSKRGRNNNKINHTHENKRTHTTDVRG